MPAPFGIAAALPAIGKALGAAGGIIGGIGSIAGAFKGSGGTDYTGMTHGIRLRVRDAKAAGIHPLYALGAPVYQPTQTFGHPNTLGAAGRGLQQIGKAITPTDSEYDDLTKTNMHLRNRLLEAQINDVTQGTKDEDSALPGDELAQAKTVETKAAAPQDPGVAAGANPAFKIYRDDFTGVIRVEMDQELAEAMESAGRLSKWQQDANDLIRHFMKGFHGTVGSQKMKDYLDMLDTEGRRTGVVRPGEKVIFSQKWQRPQVVKIKPKKSLKKATKGKPRYKRPPGLEDWRQQGFSR